MSAEQGAAQLVDAFNRRVRIEQTKGVLAQVHSISVDEAFALLVVYVNAHQQSLGDVTRAVLEDPAKVPDLMTPPR